MQTMTTSETQSCATSDLVETLGDLERLFALMRGAQVAIVELPGLKVVMHADQPVVQRFRGDDQTPAAPTPTSMHDDPMLYSDGLVPTFGS
jgi:hypothetical protein